MSIPAIPKKRGRPATGRDPTITVRLPVELVYRVELWAAARKITRSEAIRAMCETVLQADAKP